MINAMTHEYKNSRISLLDCIEGMKQYPDKYFDLAVVDPPYGLNIANANDTKGGSGVTKKTNYTKKNWDLGIPNQDYFTGLIRVSKNQIVWGANYFGLIGGYIFWDKEVTMPTFSRGELAYCSLINKVDYIKLAWHGMIQHDMTNKENRIHPTQKPIALYDWIYKNYLPQGGKVLDTHLGSQSNRISAFKRGNIDFTAFELDSDYFRDGNARFDAFVAKYEPASEIDKTADGQFKMF